MVQREAIELEHLQSGIKTVAPDHLEVMSTRCGGSYSMREEGGK